MLSYAQFVIFTNLIYYNFFMISFYIRKDKNVNFRIPVSGAKYTPTESPAED